MEELGPILIVAYIILMLLAKSKKKAPPKPRPRQQVLRVPTTEPSREALKAERPGSLEPQQQAGPPVPERSLAEELLSMLQGQAEPRPEPVVLLPEVDDEAQSLEVIEPEEIERHRRSRERMVDENAVESPYIIDEYQAPRPYAEKQAGSRDAYAVKEVASPEPYAVHHPRRRRGNLTRSELRHAFIMREVLGPPKALEE